MPSVDGNNAIDWGRTSGDYARHRPNYPDRFFDMLASFDTELAVAEVKRLLKPDGVLTTSHFCWLK